MLFLILLKTNMQALRIDGTAIQVVLIQWLPRLTAVTVITVVKKQFNDQSLHVELLQVCKAKETWSQEHKRTLPAALSDCSA